MRLLVSGAHLSCLKSVFGTQQFSEIWTPASRYLDSIFLYAVNAKEMVAKTIKSRPERFLLYQTVADSTQKSACSASKALRMRPGSKTQGGVRCVYLNHLSLAT
jgi:hypothetical protein